MKTKFERYIKDDTKIDNDMNLLLYWDNNKRLCPTLF